MTVRSRGLRDAAVGTPRTLGASGRRFRTLALGLALTLPLAACEGRRGCGGDRTEGAPAALAQVPAPADLLADVVVATPSSTWSRAQRGVGGAAGMLPMEATSIVGMLAGLDPRLASELDALAPMFGVLAGDPSAPAYCVAMKLVDPRRARIALFEGELASYTAREEGGLTLLVPRTRPASTGTAPRGWDGASTIGAPTAAALTPSGHFVFGRTHEELLRLAPYATQSLAARPVPTDGAVVVDVPREAVAKAFAPRLEAAWKDAKSYLIDADSRARADHGGRAPDFGDPQAIVAAVDASIGRRLDVVRDLDHVRLTVDLSEDAVGLTAKLTPSSGGPSRAWTSSMRVGDASALLGVPSSAVFAVSTRDTAEERKAMASELERAARASLGPRLTEADAKRLHDVLAEAPEVVGELLTFSVPAGPAAGLTMRTKPRSEGGQALVKSAVGLASVGPFKELLRVKDVRFGATDAAGEGRVELATLVHQPPPQRAQQKATPTDPRIDPALHEFTKALAKAQAESAKTPPPDTTVAWSLDAEALDVAIANGPDALATLRETRTPDRHLRDEAFVARFVGGRAGSGAELNTVAVLQPLRLSMFRLRRGFGLGALAAAAAGSGGAGGAAPGRAPGAEPTGPVLPIAASLGREGGDAVVRVEASTGLLREASRTLLGL